MTENYPSLHFYCYLKMLTKYLGNEAWQIFRTQGVRFSVGETALDRAQSWLLMLQARGLPSPGLCVLEHSASSPGSS